MKKFIVLILAFLALNGQGIAQDACKELLLTYVEDLGKFRKPVNKEAYKLAMFIKNTGTTKEVPESMQVNAVMGSDFIIYDSDLLSVYQDTVDSFMLLHDSKTILRSKASRNQTQDTHVQAVHQFQLSMVEKAKLNSCAEVEEGGKQYKLIDISPDPESLQRDNIRYLTFYLDEEKEKIAKVIVSYTPESSVQRQEIHYQMLKLEKSYKREPLQEKLFTADGSLLPKYKSYRLIDNRQ